jgi:DNA-binding response OmpR family regulator
MTTIRTCTHCGAIIPWGNPFNLTNQELKIYNYIARHPGCNVEQIKCHVYHDDPNGGPISSNIISVQLSNLRRKLTGVSIKTRAGRDAPYYLVKEPLV